MKHRFISIICFALTIVYNQTNAQIISCGYQHSLSLCVNNTARAWGANTYGALGDGTTAVPNTPVQVNITCIIAVSGGGIHSLFLKNDSTAWACGINQNGALGNGTTTDSYIPTQVSLTGVVKVVGGGNHSLFIKSGGTVCSCGYNSFGQLGDGSWTARYSPVQIPELNGIIDAAGGVYHSLFLKNDSTVWACGANQAGQLGLGYASSNKLIPVQSIVLNGIIAIAAGQTHSLFLKNDGTVWACGSNQLGQLGDGTTTQRTSPVQVQGLTGIIAIATKNDFSLFLKNDGTVWACGDNQSGQLGNGTANTNSNPSANQIYGLTGIVAISAGNQHSLFLKNDGTVWACGYNGYGNLGDGTTINNFSPIQVIGLCTLLEIKENYNKLSVIISPNPFSTQTTLQTYILLKEATLIVYNSQGQKVKQINNISGRTVTFTRDNLPSGLYFLCLTEGNKILVIDKLVIIEN